MTSFISWLGADSRGPTSLYFASDSRISWGNDPNTWDTGRKLFAARGSPEIFGFTGYVLLPQAILTRACDFIDRGFRSASVNESPEKCAEWLAALVQSEARSHPRVFQDGFAIFYGLRSGEGMPDRSRFSLFHIGCSSRSGIVSTSAIPIPRTSSILRIDGSGGHSIERWATSWENSDQGGTSRTMFSAFCDSISSGEDKCTGGEPQLVGLHRKGNGLVFGIVTKNGPSVEGMLDIAIDSTAEIKWHDPLFQRVDRTGALLKNAQSHARPRQVAKAGTKGPSSS